MNATEFKYFSNLYSISAITDPNNMPFTPPALDPSSLLSYCYAPPSGLPKMIGTLTAE
jgi:hypothetical protein